MKKTEVAEQLLEQALARAAKRAIKWARAGLENRPTSSPHRIDPALHPNNSKRKPKGKRRTK